MSSLVSYASENLFLVIFVIVFFLITVSLGVAWLRLAGKYHDVSVRLCEEIEKSKAVSGGFLSECAYYAEITKSEATLIFERMDRIMKESNHVIIKDELVERLHHASGCEIPGRQIERILDVLCRHKLIMEKRKTQGDYLSCYRVEVIPTAELKVLRGAADREKVTSINKHRG